MDAQTKDQLVAELRDYLDTLPDTPNESGPDASGDADTRSVDLYTLFTEMAGLRNEVRLESRQLKRALDEFNTVVATLEDNNKQLGTTLDTHKANQARAVADTERTLLLTLIDIRDRLVQARDLATRHQPGALARRFAQRQTTLIRDMGDGLDITLRRLDQTLARHDVAAVPAVGEILDPHRMQVATVRSEPAQADGTVLEELRRGYRRGDDMLRLAEVVANKHTDTEHTP